MQIKHSNEKSAVMTVILLVGGLFPLGGCRICTDCEDLAYPAYGGSWQRTLRNEGRVGSVFAPAGGKTSKLIDRDVPPDTVDLERQRQEEKDNQKENLLDLESSEAKSESDQTGSDYDLPLEPLRDAEPENDKSDEEHELQQNVPEDINVNRGPNPNSPITAAIKRILPF
ncbi:MAG: hypothetical protein VYA84_05510 [Planctomycetota bacterium]|nr:hypothetical protein [Planctomycetota bacterium]